MDQYSRRGANPADPKLRAELQDLIDERELDPAAQELLMTPATLARIVAGGPVRDGTIVLARARLRAVRTRSERGHLRLVPAPGPEHISSVLGRVLSGIRPDGDPEGGAA